VILAVLNLRYVLLWMVINYLTGQFLSCDSVEIVPDQHFCYGNGSVWQFTACTFIYEYIIPT
jgi:hypothetical protein